MKLAALRAGRALSRRYPNDGSAISLRSWTSPRGVARASRRSSEPCEKNGSPQPVFNFEEDHTYFEVILPIHPAAAGDSLTPHETPITREDSLNQTTQQVSPKSSAPFMRYRLGLSRARSSSTLSDSLTGRV